MQKMSNHHTLSERGILFPNGTISQDKINLISGAIASPFFETLYTFTGNNVGAMERIWDLFNHLYNEGKEREVLEIFRILNDLTGLEYPEEVELLVSHTEARHYFLFSLLLDMDDLLQDIKLDITV